MDFGSASECQLTLKETNNMLGDEGLPHGTAMWITWHDHARSRSIAGGLNVPISLYRPDKGLRRHLGGAFWAISVLVTNRPLIVFTHFSFALQICCSLYKRLRWDSRIVLVADCHNKALKRDLSGSLGALYRFMKSWSLGNADLLIVSNELMVPVARGYNRHVLTLRDPLPDLDYSHSEDESERTAPNLTTSRGHVLFICSFDADEPVDLIFSAAPRLADTLGCTILISGDPSRAQIPDWLATDKRVVFTGYMPWPLYVETLKAAAVVVVLTNDSDCLVCGGYEGVAAARPTVLSDTPALRACFGDTAIYTRHESSALITSIRAAMEARLIRHGADPIQELRAAFEREWQVLLFELRRLVRVNDQQG